MSHVVSRSALVVVLSSLLFGSPCLRAAKEPPVIVITPSLVAQPIDEVGATVYRLDVPKLIDRGVLFVEDALSEIPSLQVSSYGARGSQVQMRVRGNEANHVLVLIDGQRVSSATTGEFDLSSLSLEGIDSIEVLMGPQSTLYGSDAIAGVISIRTLKGREGLAGNLGIEAARRGEREMAASLLGGHKGFDYAITVEDFRTDGISAAAESEGNTEPDAFDKQAARLSLGYRGAGFELDARLGRTDSGYDFDGFDYSSGRAVDETGNHQDVSIDERSLSLRIPGRVTHEFLLGRVENDYQSESISFGLASSYQADTQRTTFDYRGQLRINDHHQLQFGLEQVDEELTTSSAWSSFDGDATLKGAYLNWLYQQRDLNLSVGARGNDHDAFGSFSTWRVTASYALNPQWRLKGMAGTGFKAPSLQELYDTTFGANPALKPEESDSAEIGVEYHHADYRMTLTWFDQQTDKLIRYIGVWPNARNENVGEASSHGLELSLNRDWERISLDLSLSRTHAREHTDSGVQSRLRVPQWAADARMTYRHDRGQLWLQAKYRDDRRDFNWGSMSDVILKGYTLWDLGASVHPSDTLTLTARVENLTNERYEEVFSYGVADRTVHLAARWKF